MSVLQKSRNQGLGAMVRAAAELTELTAQPVPSLVAHASAAASSPFGRGDSGDVFSSSSAGPLAAAVPLRRTHKGMAKTGM